MRTRLAIAAAVAFVLSGSSGVEVAAAPHAEPPASSTASPFAEAAAPGFLENGGRLPEAVAFTLDASDRTFFFTPRGVTVSLHDGSRGSGRWVVRLAFDGTPGVAPAPSEQRAGETNILKGPKAEWRVGLRKFGRVTYRDLWPGIDLVWTVEPGRLKWRCDVRPGADPSCVRFAVEGAERLGIRTDGSFAAETLLGDFIDAAPEAWQIGGDGRTPVASAFRLDGGLLSVALGAFDATRPLVIDPSTVFRTLFVGGGADESAASIAVDVNRNLYLAGSTHSIETTFPVLTGPDLTYNGGPDDAFVTRIDTTFHPVWTGYIGGGASDGANAVAVDTFGGVYVAGQTSSPDFPVVGALAPTAGGGFDAFVAKIASNGRSLSWTGRIGGPAEDRALAVAVDRQFRVVVTGKTAGGIALLTGYRGGSSDGFAMGVNPGGAFFDWGSYFGGSQADSCTGVALDLSGNVYLCGNTNSDQASFFPGGGPDLTPNGGQDAWVAKLLATNFVATYSGFIGGAGNDDAAAIAIDSLGRAYVVGSTTSDETTFPVAVGPHLVHHGKSDAYVARVAADGSKLEYCGYLGGSGDDYGFGVAVDSSRRAHVVGACGSTEKGFPALRALFPVVDGPDLTFNGGVRDGFVGVTLPDGSQMASLGYLGGSGNTDEARGIALLPSSVVVAGTTTSPAKSFPAGQGPAIVSRGAREAFVSEIQWTPPSPVLLVPALSGVNPVGFDVKVDWSDADPNDTGFEVQRSTIDGPPALFSVASTKGTIGPTSFTDTTASPGTTYAWRVRPFDANGKGEFSEPLLVLTTPSIDLKLKKSALTGAGTDGLGRASLRFKYAFQAGSATTSLDPATDGVSFTIAGAGADQLIAIPPGDPNWAVGGPVFSWTAPTPGLLRLVIDTARRTIKLDASGLTFAVPLAHNPVRVSMTSGGSYGSRTADWRGVRGTQYRTP